MKEKQYNPAGTNDKAPAEGMAAVNTFNPEEIEETSSSSIPKNFERNEVDRSQHDDTTKVTREDQQ
ncbi:MAG TPA: hypothetical protein VFQ73_02080 [Flavisolibacter sp.]|nr:hypothetical protein [Flavisolibacter sp.]